jgi:LuxR family maltose regulon positive regulatory protein
LEIGNPRLVELVRAFEAEFELRLGREAQASRWAQTHSRATFREFHLLYIPQLTLPKVQLAEASSESIRAAVASVDGLLATSNAVHDVPVRIQGLSLLALAHAAEGEQGAAIEKLAAALELAAPGGFVRPFVDLGAPMLSLLGRLPEEVAGTEHVGRILAACGAKPPAREARPLTSAVVSDGAGALFEPLSRREQDVLELLTERLRDKEIAEKLFVSPATVKSHLRCLYRKLDVGDRREAVARARELGILAGG